MKNENMNEIIPRRILTGVSTGIKMNLKEMVCTGFNWLRICTIVSVS
jgi:hypothetical protein